MYPPYPDAQASKTFQSMGGRGDSPSQLAAPMIASACAGV
jgi:hypothetical protein